MQTQGLTQLASTLLLSLSLATATAADDQFKDIEIQTTGVGNGIYMLTGKGGNIGVSTGTDGVFLIDDQFAPLSEKIKAAIAALSDQPVRFLLNTHWHPDHTGGNEDMGKTGTVIVAHNNVRKRLAVDNFIEMFGLEAPATDITGLPVITFDSSLTFHLNGGEIIVSHVSNAHTDGDSIVWFRNANIIHTGDIYFAGMYPFIDTNSGGSLEGTINALEQVLAMSDDKTVIIPGHGPVSNKSSLLAYTDMLKTISSTLRKMIAGQSTLEQIQAAEPTRDFDGNYGDGFIKNTAFVDMLYQDMVQD
ncbi:MAG TPA: MBL fold metallo-hydrolase [Gammaproteobacteria bacterium]|nr:MBL fold metallo-hydrolase [Gammaproteobacteria bacterium]